MMIKRERTHLVISDREGNALDRHIKELKSVKRGKATFPKNQDELTKRYSRYLEEIVDRTWVVIKLSQKILSGETVNEYTRVDLDLCYLQLRKAMECLAYALSLFHRISKESLSESNLRTYKIGQIFKELEKRNPHFFPKPSKIVEVDGVVQITDREPLPDFPSLTRKQAEDIYSIMCGNELHADHDYNRLDTNSAMERALFLNHAARAVLGLLSYHRVNLDDQYMLVAGISDKKNSEEGAFAQIGFRTRNF